MAREGGGRHPCSRSSFSDAVLWCSVTGEVGTSASTRAIKSMSRAQAGHRQVSRGMRAVALPLLKA
jgi:hypothetical protein